MAAILQQKVKSEMKEAGVLSEVQMEQFHRDGFLVVQGMYSRQEIRLISEWTEEVASLPGSSGQNHDVFRGKPG